MAKTKKPVKKAGRAARKKARAAEQAKTTPGAKAAKARSEASVSRPQSAATPATSATAPAKTSAPANAPVPSEPPESAKTVEAAKTARPAEPVQTAKPAKPVEPAKSAAPAKPGTSGATATKGRNKNASPGVASAEQRVRPSERIAGATPASAAVPESVSKASLPLQTFAIEVQKMARQSIEQTTDVLESLRDAKSVEDVVSLQTKFMQQSFHRYTEFAGRIGELISASQSSLFQQGQAAIRSFRSIAAKSGH